MLELVAKAVLSCSFIVANYDLNSTHGPKKLASANWFNKRRGPDATNLVVQHGWTFLHNLLSMTGAVTLQPFMNTDGSVVAIFNGEVYNYRDLALELTGSADAFASDGYSILPAYARWGPRFVKRFEGEFALVIVDFNKQHAVVSPDVFGTKPLWYATWQAGSERNEHTIETRFMVASYESVLVGMGVPHDRRRLATPNRAIIIPFDGLSERKSFRRTRANERESNYRQPQIVSQFLPPGARGFPLKVWDFRQFKTYTSDWEAAFLRSVQRRTSRLKHRVFIGLSSGYDSGAIDLALQVLQVPHLAISLKGKENTTVLEGRRARLGDSWISVDVTDKVFATQYDWLRNNIETYRSVHYSGSSDPRHRNQYLSVTNERPAIGFSLIIARARPLSGLVYLSGQGSDEIISDYSFGPGNCIMTTSCSFNGTFPANLSEIYPWRNFYGGLNRANLMREELTAGAHGVEGRYPFLDPGVVQEYLWLHQNVKNSEYKRPVADFLRKHNYPNAFNWKSGFVVYDHIAHWKKINKDGRRHEEHRRREEGKLQHSRFSEASSRDETPV